MAEPLSDDEREADVIASPMKSGSTDWELVLSTSSSPVLQSGDELSGLEIGGVHALSLAGPSFERDGLVQDNYFGLEAGFSDDVPPASLLFEESMNESVKQVQVTGLSFDSHGSDIPQITAPRLAVSSDAKPMESFSPPFPFATIDNDMRQSTVEPQCLFDDSHTDAALQQSREFCQDDSALLPFSLPAPSHSVIKTCESSNLSTVMTDVDQSGDEVIDRDGKSVWVDHGGQSEVAAQTQTFFQEKKQTQTLDSVLGNANTRDDSGGNRLGEVIRSERSDRPLSDCWLHRQLCMWQARLGQAKTLCSVTLAAAIVGILILGRRWQRLRAQNRILLLQLRAKDKKITQLMFQLLQMKESLSKTRQIPVIRSKPSLQIPQDRP